MQVTVAQSFFKKIALLEEKVEQRVMEKASDIVTDAVDQSPVYTGAFVESFLVGGAEVLVQDRPLLAALDVWLMELDAETFLELLPMLRRGFADFAESGRQRILGIVGSGKIADQAALARGDEDASREFVEHALPLLRTILGIAA